MLIMFASFSTGIRGSRWRTCQECLVYFLLTFVALTQSVMAAQYAGRMALNRSTSLTRCQPYRLYSTSKLVASVSISQVWLVGEEVTLGRLPFNLNVVFHWWVFLWHISGRCECTNSSINFVHFLYIMQLSASIFILFLIDLPWQDVWNIWLTSCASFQRRKMLLPCLSTCRLKS